MKRPVLLTVATVLGVFCISAEAGPTYSFVNITNNDAGNAAIGQAQLFVEVDDPGDNRVVFTFTNTGPNAQFDSQKTIAA